MGVTRLSLRSIRRHLAKVGTIQYIRGYIDGLNKWNRVAIVGDKGRMILGGFCWGYCGEGPRGLRETLMLCGVDEKYASTVAFTTPTNQSHQGEEWRITFKEGNTIHVKIDLRHTLKNFPIQELAVEASSDHPFGESFIKQMNNLKVLKG